MRPPIKVRWIVCLGLVVFVGASVRVERVTVSTQNRSQTHWRVLLPGQPSQMDQMAQPDDSLLKADEYAVFGLLHVGGRFSRHSTVVND
jgi:hypothetical protein